MIPPRLDGVAELWSAYILSVPSTQHENITKHIDGSHSVYEMLFVFHTAFGDKRFYYIGNTGRPTKRPSEHVSEFTRCSVKTAHGKSKLYDPAHMTGLIGITFEFTVLESGFETEALAEERAREVAAEYEALHTQEFMLSNQNRGRGKDRRPRHRRAVKAT